MPMTRHSYHHREKWPNKALFSSRENPPLFFSLWRKQAHGTHDSWFNFIMVDRQKPSSVCSPTPYFLFFFFLPFLVSVDQAWRWWQDGNVSRNLRTETSLLIMCTKRILCIYAHKISTAQALEPESSC